MASNITVGVTGNLTVTDASANTVPFSKSLSQSFAGTVSEIVQGYTAGTTQQTISLPISPVQFLYMKNLNTSNSCTVAWTPQGGSTETVQLLQPGAFIMYGQVAQSTNTGITDLRVTASGSNTLLEFTIAG
jgi:hypothetical protein